MTFLTMWNIPTTLLGIAVYLYTALALWSIGKKTGVEERWWAFIPAVGQLYIAIRMSGYAGWWFFLFFAHVVIASFLSAALTPLLILWVIPFTLFAMGLAHNCKRSRFWGLLWWIPLINLLVLGIIAWGNPDKEEKKEQKKEH